MLVTDVSVDRATLTVERAFDGTAAVAHGQDAVVEHTISASEMQWLSDHINGTRGHGLTSPIVGEDDVQTLKNKTINDTDNEIIISTNSITNYNQTVAARDANFVKRNSAMGATERVPNEAGVPTGTIVIWPGAGTPVGWLRCDGALYQQADYPELYSILGGTFTDPPQTTAFAVPDLTAGLPDLHYIIFDGIGGA
jgi:Phage Tail Collar Domain